MNKYLAFEDVLIVPKFSEISSRKNVDLSISFLGLNLKNCIISSNMDTITESHMAAAMIKNGGMGCLHRFCTIERNVEMFYETIDLVANADVYFNKPMVSVGVGDNEYKRAMALYDAGATHFIIDVAHGAAQHVVNMYDRLRSRLSDNCYIIVGNFATADSIKEFNKRIKNRRLPDAYKIGIGGGSLCTTRVVTGAGLPTLASILECKSLGFPIISDGGIRSSGDVSKSLAAGASLVMLGGMISGTDETPGELIYEGIWTKEKLPFSQVPKTAIDSHYKLLGKKYRGSASKSSYEVQGKSGTPEGEETLVAYKGSVKDIIKNIEGGLKSSFSYVGAKDLTSFQKNAIMVEITSNGTRESQAHGKI